MSAASPDLAPDELAALRESIRTLGQLVPIVVRGDDVIDGRKRLACCEALGLEPKVIRLAVDTDDARASEHASALNLLRTHYSTSQRAMYAGRIATLKRGDVGGGRLADGEINPSARPPTTDEAAAMMGVNATSVKQAKALRRDAAPEVVEAIERGELTLHAGKTIARNVPRAQQAEATTRVIAAKSGRYNMSARALGTAAPRRPPTPSGPRGPRQRPMAEVLTNLFTHIEHATEILAERQYADAALPDAATQAAWAGTLDRILPPLRRFRRRLRRRRIG